MCLGRRIHSLQYTFSYEWQRLEMTNTLNKVELFFISCVIIQDVKATMLHEVTRILGSFQLTAVPSHILMGPDAHHHCVSIAVQEEKAQAHPAFGGKTQTLLQLAHISLDSGPHHTVKKVGECSPYSAYSYT